MQPKGVRVGLVEPGIVETELDTHIRSSIREAVAKQMAGVEKLRPEDIADAARSLRFSLTKSDWISPHTNWAVRGSLALKEMKKPGNPLVRAISDWIGAIPIFFRVRSMRSSIDNLEFANRLKRSMIGCSLDRLRICSLIVASLPLRSSVTIALTYDSGTFCCSTRTRVCERYSGCTKKVIPNPMMGKMIAGIAMIHHLRFRMVV